MRKNGRSPAEAAAVLRHKFIGSRLPDWFDPAVQKIHIAHLLFCAKSRTGNRRLSLPLVRLLFLRTARPPSRGYSIIPAHPRRIVKHGFPAARHQDLRR